MHTYFHVLDIYTHIFLLFFFPPVGFCMANLSPMNLLYGYQMLSDCCLRRFNCCCLLFTDLDRRKKMMWIIRAVAQNLIFKCSCFVDRFLLQVSCAVPLLYECE